MRRGTADRQFDRRGGHPSLADRVVLLRDIVALAAIVDTSLEPVRCKGRSASLRYR